MNIIKLSRTAVILVSIFLLGFFSALTLLKSNISKIQEASTVSIAPRVAPTKKEKGFYGQVLDRDQKYLIVQQLLSHDVYGATVLRIFVGEKARIFSVLTRDNVSWKLLPQIAGSLEGIKKGSFVYIVTADPLVATPAIHALSIVTSDSNPFASTVQKK